MVGSVQICVSLKQPCKEAIAIKSSNHCWQQGEEKIGNTDKSRDIATSRNGANMREQKESKM